MRSSHELGDSSTSTASLELRFSRAWVKTRSINSALLPLILRTFSFRYIFRCLWACAFTSFSIVQEISGRVFLSLTLFLDFASRNSRCCTSWTFTCSLVHVVMGTYLLQRPFFLQKKTISPGLIISLSGLLGETYRSSLQWTLP